MQVTPAETVRFWSKVGVGAQDACWDWRASLFPNGYGQFKWQGQSIQAHRIAWALAHGGTLEGVRHICHRCDNRKCCNPSHLFHGTARDNVHDAINKGRRQPIVRSRQGESSNWAKLTAQQVREIRAAYSEEDVTHKQLAARYGVTNGAILRIVNRLTWKHI